MSRFSKATKRGRRTSRSVVLPNKAGGSETSRLEDEKEGEERRGEESGANPPGHLGSKSARFQPDLNHHSP